MESKKVQKDSKPAEKSSSVKNAEDQPFSVSADAKVVVDKPTEAKDREGEKSIEDKKAKEKTDASQETQSKSTNTNDKGEEGVK